MAYSFKGVQKSLPLALVLLCRLSTFSLHASRLHLSQRAVSNQAELIYETAGERLLLEEAPSPKEEVSPRVEATPVSTQESLPSAVLEVSEVAREENLTASPARNGYSLYKGCDYHVIKEEAENGPLGKRRFLNGWCPSGMSCGFQEGTGHTFEECVKKCEKRSYCIALAFKYNVMDEKNSGCKLCSQNSLESAMEEVDFGIWKKQAGNSVATQNVDVSARKPVGKKPSPLVATPSTEVDGLSVVEETESPKFDEVKPPRASSDIRRGGIASPQIDIVVNTNNYCEADWSCSRSHWSLAGDKIKEGSYGQVWPVAEPSHDNATEAYAIKFPVSYDYVAQNKPDKVDCKDIRTEAKMMREIAKSLEHLPDECANIVMLVKDGHPCLDGSPVPGSYVMEKMDGDLDSWRKKYAHKPGVETKCMPEITRKVMLAIDCFHRGDWVHADIKLANILYKGLKDDCPQDLRLADFGMSGRKDTATRNMFKYTDYKNCWYLPSDMFWVPQRLLDEENAGAELYTLNLAQYHNSKFTHGLALDWCALHLTWKIFFGTNPENPYWSGNCGLMGPNRESTLVVQPSSGLM